MTPHSFALASWIPSFGPGGGVAWETWVCCRCGLAGVAPQGGPPPSGAAPASLAESRDCDAAVAAAVLRS